MESFEEGVGADLKNVEVKAGEDDVLHLNDFFFGVGFVSDVHEVANFRSVDFFVFGGYEHCADCDKLELTSFDSSDAEEAVDEINCEVKSLGV